MNEDNADTKLPLLRTSQEPIRDDVPNLGPSNALLGRTLLNKSQITQSTNGEQKAGPVKEEAKGQITVCTRPISGYINHLKPVARLNNI
jgi:hypothetical protein